MSLETSILGFDPTSLSVFAQPESKGGSNYSSNIYHPRPADSKSTDGIYRATIRVLYSPQDIRRSILQRQSYAMVDSQGFFQVVSKLTDNDTTCPVFTAWKQCRYSKNPALQAQATPKDKGGNGMFDKRFERYVTIQVIDDQNNPDLNNQYLFWKLPKFVYDAILSKMTPSPESNKAPIPVMDALFGRLIYLEVKPGPDDPSAPERKTREISYSTTEVSDDIQSCVNPDGTPLLTADQQEVLDKYIAQMSKVWKSRNAEERQKLTAEIEADENTKKLGDIYKEVIEHMKEFVPDLNGELGYKEWSAETTARVNNWIKCVLNGENPQTAIPATSTEAIAKEAETTTSNIPNPATAAPAPAAAVDTDANEDLPF